MEKAKKTKKVKPEGVEEVTPEFAETESAEQVWDERVEAEQVWDERVDPNPNDQQKNERL